MGQGAGRSKIAILFALDEEKRGLERVLVESRVPAFSQNGITTYLTRGAEVLVLTGGIGRERAARAAESLLGAGASVVVSAGFAAALDPCARVGDILVGNHVFMCGSDAEPIECSPQVRSLLPPSGAFGFPIRLCNVVTGDRVLSAPAEKVELFSATGAAIYDMETYAVALACHRYHVPFAAIRGVSDTAGQSIPDVVPALMEARSLFVRAALVAGSPASWIRLLRLRKQASIATEHLGDVLGTMLVRIP